MNSDRNIKAPDHAAEAKGHPCLFFRIAGIVMEVKSDLPLTEITFHPKFKAFETDGPGEDTIHIRHHFASPPFPAGIAGRKVCEEPPWVIYEGDDRWVYMAVPEDPAPKPYYQMAVFSKDYSQADIYNPDPEIFIRGGLQSLSLFPTDQILLAQVLAARQACYMHASGVILRNKGLLFLGHSEAGKSTMVKMLKGRAEILCDDRVIIRKWPDGFKIHGNWSHGEVPDVSPNSAELRAVFFLIKSNENLAVRVNSKKEIIKDLLDCLIKPYTPASWWERMLSLSGGIAAEIPFYKLYFDTSGKVIDLLDSV